MEYKAVKYGLRRAITAEALLHITPLTAEPQGTETLTLLSPPISQWVSYYIYRTAGGAAQTHNPGGKLLCQKLISVAGPRPGISTSMLICRAFLYHIAINTISHIVQASQCLGGQDIFAKVRENSPYGVVVAKFSSAEGQTANSARWCLTGEDAGWFFLEGRTIRLNTSSSRTLDREVQGSALMTTLKCYEDQTIQSEYRVMVEILNENDNRPMFQQEGGLTFAINELTPVNAVAFTVQARDADGDTVMYVIDKSLLDASHFRIDLPNSGDVILDKPLDYESKTELHIEMNTMERYSTSTTITVNVLDGDDQYPQFRPCTVLNQEMVHPVCTNPVYSANITEMQKDAVLFFSPGPIYAEDGDKGLGTPVVYTIVSGSDDGRFHINNETGDVVLRRPLKNRIQTLTFRLRIMASQVDDPRKYTVATALIRVLAENRFPLHFTRTSYKGFVTEGTSLATLVSTYGNEILVIQATDDDFKDGVNPKINYSTFNSSKLFRVTNEGFLVAMTSQLRAFERHVLQVLATDEESGDTANVSVDIEVLQKGQQVPRSAFGEERLYDVNVNASALGGIAAAVLLLLLAACFASLQLAKCRRKRLDRAEGGAAAPERHRNLGQQINPRRLLTFSEDVFCHDDALQECDMLGSILYGKQGIYIKKEDMPTMMTCDRECDVSEVPSMMAPVFVISQPLTRGASIIHASRTPHGSLTHLTSRAEGATSRANEVTESPHQTAEDERAPETTLLKWEQGKVTKTRATSSPRAAALHEATSAARKTRTKQAGSGFDSANAVRDGVTSAACLTEQTDDDTDDG